MNYVDKAAYNVVVVCRLYNINSLKRELVDTNAYKQTAAFFEFEVIVDVHGCHTALHFGVKAMKTKTQFLRCTGYQIL